MTSLVGGDLSGFMATLRNWQIAFTVTFRIRSIKPHQATGQLFQALADIGKLLRGVDDVAMLEAQADGTPHFHGVISCEREITRELLLDIRRILRTTCGHESVQRVRSEGDRRMAARYVLKSYDSSPPEYLIVSRGL